jgi:hypothetical protein
VIPVLSGVGLDASNSSWHTRSNLLLSAFLLYPHPRNRKTHLYYAAPPRWIVLCGIQDRPCVTYLVVYHLRTQAHGDSQSDGVDYERKTISLAWCNDRFKNVEALEHEVIHAALWERGFPDTDSWAIRDWIYFSDETLPLLFHDNPQFAEYLTGGY